MADVNQPMNLNPLDLNTSSSESVEYPDGSVDIIFDEETSEDEFVEVDHYENLVTLLTDKELDDLGREVVESTAHDETSREEWIDQITKGLTLLGLKIEETDTPFEGACSAHHPLILEAAVKFQSKVSSELFPAKGPVKTAIMGDPTPEKELQATRVRNHMNWQITEQIEEFFPESEKSHFYTALVGTGIKKLYWSASMQRPVSEFISSDQFVINNNEKSLQSAQRYTHIIYLSQFDYEREVHSGLYSGEVNISASSRNDSRLKNTENELSGMANSEGGFSDVVTLLEQHVNLVLPIEAGHPEEMEGIALPYIVTVDKDSSKVVSIRRNWDEGDSTYKKTMWFSDYHFVPTSLGFYSLGLIHLLGNTQLTLTTVLRSMVDAGQFANLQGGFKSKNFRMTGNASGPLGFGEFRDVEAPGAKLSDGILLLPTKEPSQTLFNMLQYISNAGQKFADSTEQVIADSNGQGPVGTTMALLEASTKFFSAIHKRFHYSQKQEFKILARINSIYLDQAYPYEVPGASREVFAQDYDGRIDVLPVSDPNESSNAHRVTKAQTLFQMAQQMPEEFNKQELMRRVLTAMGVEDLEKVLVQPQEAQPQDPISDIMTAVKGMPIQAFPGQDHDAHITVKRSWLIDPMNGASEFMVQTAPVIEANIREHMVIKYQEQVQGAMQNMGQEVIQGAGMEVASAIAAQQISQANQLVMRGELENTPEDKLAQAEVMKAEVARRTQEAKEIEAVLDHDIKLKELQLKAEELGLKITIEDTKNMIDMAKTRLKEGTSLMKEAAKNETSIEIAKLNKKEVDKTQNS